jgi:hypothetical protein
VICFEDDKSDLRFSGLKIHAPQQVGKAWVGAQQIEVWGPLIKVCATGFFGLPNRRPEMYSSPES